MLAYLTALAPQGEVRSLHGLAKRVHKALQQAQDK